MELETNHNLLIEAEPEEIETLEPLIQDISILISSVKKKEPAQKATIIDECRDDLTEVMRKNSDERIMPPREMLDMLATYGIIKKAGQTFQTKSSK